MLPFPQVSIFIFRDTVRFLTFNGLWTYEMDMCVNLGLMTCVVMWLLMVLVVILLPMSSVLHFASAEKQGV